MQRGWLGAKRRHSAIVVEIFGWVRLVVGYLWNSDHVGMGIFKTFYKGMSCIVPIFCFWETCDILGDISQYMFRIFIIYNTGLDSRRVIIIFNNSTLDSDTHFLLIFLTLALS